jgi:hypothetical protein
MNLTSQARVASVLPSDVTDVEDQLMRSSDRVYLELPIIISGSDHAGRKFVENTQTLVISRRGAKIISRQALSPRQMLAIRCLKTGQDAAVRVVGPITGEEEGCHFAVAFIHPEVNFWGISFPLLDGSESAAGRVFLECATCNAQEVVHLDVFELEVLLANECLTRPCPHCNEPTLWVRSTGNEDSATAGRVPPVPRHPSQERKSPRINLKVTACIRNIAGGDDVVTTENVSRGGFRFVGQKEYAVGTTIEAALPYSAGSANIFTPAKIVHRQEGFVAGMFTYGVAYLPSSLAPSLTGMRITQPK